MASYLLPFFAAIAGAYPRGYAQNHTYFRIICPRVAVCNGIKGWTRDLLGIPSFLHLFKCSIAFLQNGIPECARSLHLCLCCVSNIGERPLLLHETTHDARNRHRDICGEICKEGAGGFPTTDVL